MQATGGRAARRRVENTETGVSRRSLAAYVRRLPQSRGFDVLAAVTLAIMFCAAMAWSWGKWPDVLVDFGRELYVAWRISEGEVLYRDLAHFNGPLSPHFNALMMSALGATLDTIVLVNSILVMAAIAVMYAVLRELSDRPAALVACVTFVAIFGFSELAGTGNYNWICPYNQEVTHASLLSLVAILLLVRFARTGSPVAVGASGLCVGLVFLTKVEYFVAIGGAIGFGAALLTLQMRPPLRTLLRNAAFFLAGAVLPPVLAFALLSAALPPREALAGTMGGWAWVVQRELTDNPFYKWCMGTDEPWDRATEILKMLGVYALLCAPALGACFVFRRRKARAWVLAGILAAATASVLWLARDHLWWPGVARPWPALLLFVAIVQAIALRRRWHEEKESRQLILRLTMVAFASALLLRILFHTRMEHYGFALAMPAMAVLVVACFCWVPSAIARWGGSPVVFRAVFLAAWAVTCVVYVQASGRNYAAKRFAVGEGGNAFLADRRGELVRKVNEFLRQHARPQDTVVVMPEGIMINYLARLRTPTRYVQFFPAAMTMYGEENILAALQEASPEWVVLVHRDDSAYGHRFFGQDYARDLGRWVASNYEPVALEGNQPFMDERLFGILVGRRRTRPPER